MEMKKNMPIASEEIKGSSDNYFIPIDSMGVYILLYLSVTIHHARTRTGILGARSLGHPVRERSIWHYRIISVASVVVLRGRQRSGLDVQKGCQLTPSIRPVTARRKAWTKRQRPLVDQEVYI